MQDHLDDIVGATLTISRTLRHRMVMCKDSETNANMLQFHALMHIRECEGMTMKELANFLKITSPSATSFVNRLVKLGWVERVADSENRKLVRLKVSAKGLSMLQTKMNERTHIFREMLALLPMKDQEDLSRILSHLAISLSTHSS